MAPRGEMKLGVFLYPTGHHLAAWRHPDTQADGGMNFPHYLELALTAERGKLDMLFLADTVGARDSGDLSSWRLTPKYTGQFEPLTLLSALAVTTTNIGLVATTTTTYNEPYHVARKYASLDHLSGGRAGWNLVTSSSPVEAFNFGRDEHVAHADRYARAREFAEVVRGLWDTWEDDAFLRDKNSGEYFDREKVHFLHHKGAHFKVRGPLNVARPPQGHPVIVQAGSSEAGRALAAETADVVFTAQRDLSDAQTFYSDLKGRLGTYGRSEDELKILPGVLPIVGRTEQEAQEKFESLQALVHPILGVSLIADMLGGVDLSSYALDEPFPQNLPESNGGKGRADLIKDMARRENLTLRQTYLKIAGARGHWTVIGSPTQVADQLQERFEKFGADGFNIMPAALPQSLDDFVNLVVPELQKRGLFRKEYESKTLRGNLGLKRPPHPSASISLSPVVRAKNY